MNSAKALKRLICRCFPCRWVVGAMFAFLSLMCCHAAEPADSAALRPVWLGLRTNMLYDAMGIPDIGVEVYAGRNISVTGHWMYAWWGSARRHHLWRIYGGDLGVRYWFGSRAHDKPMTGHHAGIYAGAVTFDFQFGGKGLMGGRPGGNLWDRLLLNVGIEYGYSLPISRRLNIDFSIGIGYLGGKMEKYETKGEFNVWESSVRKTWFGPTKAEVSLVWLIGRGNENCAKGGRR